MENGAFHWQLMPSELRPNWKRKLTTKDDRSKISKVVNLEEKLKVLEQKEKNGKGEDATKEDSDNVRIRII